MDFDPGSPPPRVFVYRTQSHFDDLDAQWILHHSRQIRYVERAQQALFDQVMETKSFDPWKYPDLNIVVRKLEANYILPLKGVRPFIIAMWVTRLRAAGMTTAFEFRSADGKELYTSGYREVCKLSMETMQPELWTEEFRRRYGAWRSGRAE